MLEVPNLQATGVLTFLKTALNGDQQLVSVVGSPVIGAVAEHDPIAKNGEALEVYTTELPALGYLCKASTPHSSACNDGYEDEIELVFVNGIPQAQVIDGVAIKGDAIARRWLMAVAERAVYWLQKQRFPRDAGYATVQDYFNAYGIDSVAPKKISYSVQGSWAVARLALTLTRYLPSYSVTAHAVQETDFVSVDALLRQSFYDSNDRYLGKIDKDLEVTIAP